MTFKFSLTVGAAAALTGFAGAQTFTELMREGDPVPGAASGELIASIDNVDVNRHGDWLVELNGDGATSGDQYMLHNGSIIWQEGTSLGFTPPAGKEASSFIDTMDINDNGDILFISPVRDIGTTSTNGYLLVFNGVTVIDAGVTPCLAAGVPAGALYTGVAEAWQNNNRELLIGATITPGPGALANADILVRIDLDAAGTIIAETKLALEGEMLTGPNHVTPIQGFSFSKGRQAINDNGECIWYVDDDHTTPPGSTLSDSNMYTTSAALVNTLLYNEADTFPTDPLDTFDHFSTAEVDLNDNGDFVFSGFDRGPSTDDSWIFKSIGGVLTVIAHEGDPVPASVPGAWLVAGAGFGGVVPMSNSGDVLWFLDWDDPDTTIDTGLMFNEELILQEGVSMLGGLVIEDVPNSDSEIAMSDDGAVAIIEVILDDAIDLDAVFLVELNSPIGTSFCGPAVSNSTGGPATMAADGSDVALENDVTLSASGMPNGQFGYFINSPVQGFTPLPGGSQGNLCLGSPIGRYNTSVLMTGTAGSFSLAIDLTATPTPTGPVGIVAGQTWNFQAWFRDVNPSNTSNFSDGRSVLFN